MQKKTIWDLNRPTTEEYRAQEKLPLVLVLDNIRSLNNVGSMFRTCDAFAVHHICLCGITATPPSPEIHKTALGAEDSVAWQHFDNTLDAISALKEDGYTVCCLEQVKDSVSLEKFRVEHGKKYAVIVGHEVNGVAPEVVDAADVCIEIPQRGTKHSLNVSVSGGMALWHIFQQMI
ncbi:MAG: RNA methyltransferase [Muribaculaceae bacterium]